MRKVVTGNMKEVVHYTIEEIQDRNNSSVVRFVTFLFFYVFPILLVIGLFVIDNITDSVVYAIIVLGYIYIYNNFKNNYIVYRLMQGDKYVGSYKALKLIDNYIVIDSVNKLTSVITENEELGNNKELLVMCSNWEFFNNNFILVDEIKKEIHLFTKKKDMHVVMGIK